MKIRFTSVKKSICRMGGLVAIGSMFLSAFSTSNSADQAVNGLYLVLANVMILVLAVGLVWLITSGNFKKWGTAGLNANQWKGQKRKLENQKEKIEQDQADMMAKFGEQAWEARVSDPSYGSAFDTLLTLDQQKTQLTGNARALQEELNKVSDSRTKLAKEYAKQISDLESNHKDVAKKVEKTNSELSKLKNELEKITTEQKMSSAEIDDQRKKLAEVAASEEPDKDARISSIGESIKALEASNARALVMISEIESERAHLEIEQQPFEDKIDRLTGQMATVEGYQREALTPLDQRVAEVEQTIQAKKEAIKALEQEIAPKVAELGPLVEAAQPESEDLTVTYKKMDQIKANLGEVTQELHLINARLDTCDQGAVRNFFWMMAGILILVVLSAVFFFLAIA